MNEVFPEIRAMEQMIAEARDLPPAPAAIVGAGAEHVLHAAIAADQAGLIDPVLFGRSDRIIPLMEEFGVSYPVVDLPTPEATARAAVEAVLDERVRLLVKGDIHSDVFLRPIIRRLRREPRISHVFLAELPSYHKPVSYTHQTLPTKRIV